MTDETDDPEEDEDELGELEVEEDSASEYVECANHMLVAPKGFSWAADVFDAAFFRVEYKTATVEQFDAYTGRWRIPKTTREVVDLKQVKPEEAA